MDKWWDGYGSCVTGYARGARYDSGINRDAVVGPPRCLRCGHGEYLTRVPYGSKRDGEYICGACIDRLLRRDA